MGAVHAAAPTPPLENQGISDTVSQKLSGFRTIQFRRLLLKVVFGFAYGGPFGHFLHKLMDMIFKGKKDSKTVAKKVLLEQLTSSPWNNLFFLIYYGLIVEGRPWPQVKYKIKKDYLSVQLTSWMVFILSLCYAIVGTWCVWMHYQTELSSYSVLADCGVGQSSIYATAVACYFPQLCCLLLGCISESSREVSGLN
ncbi:peroxisomal membrane protein PMP22-like isoform X1 [Magnolia sinica]|uniref:peroxisomal membrane protein PMP22-like isoform X1 n=1 Tax=Magnolia sinica TaxID=86752 RepID=UPI00265A745A|nr:peroxisomal membrane protein PMP22-like isoform X1 [Magnolia sinica]